MRRRRFTQVLTVSLGVLFVVAGIAETIRAVVSGDGGIPFWFGSLVGGGTAILLGALVLRRRPWLSCGLVWVGCVAGAMATLWTLVIPVVALAVMVLAALQTGEEVDQPLAHG